MDWNWIFRKQIADRLVKAGSCVEFTGAIDHGYGVIKVGGRKGKKVYAHRVTYSALKGEIPPGKEVLHLCNNPKCCDPAHLILGSHAQNLQHAATSGRCYQQVKK